MIKLTGTNGEAEVLTPEQIVRVKDDVSTRVYLVGGAYVVVNESHEEVVRKIMDYKMAMARYSAASLAFASSGHTDMTAMSDYAEGDLKKLSGLEQTP